MFFGSGILKGMIVTIKNFVFSYFKKPEDGGLFTVEYPEKRLPEKENSRNFPFLVYDKTPDEPRCVACDICAKECPTKCINIIRAKDKDGKPLRKPEIFDIDISLCMGCGICESSCPFDSIFMDKDFEVTSEDKNRNLIFTKNQLLRSNEYFKKTRPSLASAIDKKRKEAEEKKKLTQK